VPSLDPGLRSRMSRVATGIEAARPGLMVVDVSVEVTVFVRLLGVPVVVMAMPGVRTDPAHRRGYQLAEHIIAAWPQEMYDPVWLEECAPKTTFAGGISRFDGRECDNTPPSGRPRVLVLTDALRARCGVARTAVDCRTDRGGSSPCPTARPVPPVVRGSAGPTDPPGRPGHRGRRSARIRRDRRTRTGATPNPRGTPGHRAESPARTGVATATRSRETCSKNPAPAQRRRCPARE
jgi:hypothetical protein